MENSTNSAPAFEFSGGALCLDFANTIGDRPRCEKETLGGIAELLRWAAEAGIVEQDRHERLAREAASAPRRAGAFFRRAIELRERLYRIFATLAAGERLDARDLAELNRALAGCLQHLQVEAARDGFAWSWAAPADGFDCLLWPVVRSAGELLTSAEAKLVRECASGDCSWLFIDRSRTHRRKWCDMKVCGNRAKARRHYRKRKQGTVLRRRIQRSR